MGHGRQARFNHISSDRSRDSLPPRVNNGRGGMPPIKVFAGLVALLIGAGTFLLLTKSGTSLQSSTGIPPSDNFALTNAEAISRFKRLDALSIRAYETQDPTLVSHFLTSDSPLTSSVQNDILKLQVHRTDFEAGVVTQDLAVRTNTASMIVIRQDLIQSVRFTKQGGRDVTKSPTRLELTVDWTLRPEGDAWLIHDSHVVATRQLSQ